jgi:hypothetical protein
MTTKVSNSESLPPVAQIAVVRAPIDEAGR